MNDEHLLRTAEETLSEIDREQGLSDRHADILAKLRIRIYGAPKKTLDDALDAAGSITGKRNLEELEEPEPAGSLDEAIERPPEKKDSLDDLL